MTYPEWQPPQPFVDLENCLHLEGGTYVELPRGNPDGETPPFRYHGQQWQGFPSGGGNDMWGFYLCDAELQNFNPVYGIIQNATLLLPPVEPYTPTDGETYHWEGLPINETPWNPNELPYVHWEVQPAPEIDPFYDIAGDPQPYHKWIPYASDHVSAEVMLYFPQPAWPPGMHWSVLALLYWHRPRIIFYRKVNDFVPGDIVVKAFPLLLLLGLSSVCCSNTLIQSPTRRRRKRA